MEDFNSKYTGEEVENLLDQVASGAIGEGVASNIYRWEAPTDDSGQGVMEGSITADEYAKIFAADIVVMVLSGVAANVSTFKMTSGENCVYTFAALAGESLTGLMVAFIKTDDGATFQIQEQAIGGASEETDPVFSASPAASITEEDKTNWNGKVDKVEGKQLSTEDFTTALKEKLEGLSNYDDSEISEAVNTLREDFDTLVSGDSTTAIKTFNEIISFLSGIEDSENLDSIIASIEQQIAGKMDKVTLSAVATSGSYNDLDDKPTIPAAVTESTVSGWGFTKNTGTYSKPSAGIPKTDLATAVQTSLGKADTALQSEQYKGTVTSVKINGTTTTPDTDGMVDLGTIEGGGGDYLPLSGGTISGDVKIQSGENGNGSLTVAETVAANELNSARWIPKTGGYMLAGSNSGFEIRDTHGDEHAGDFIFNGDGTKFLANDGTYKSVSSSSSSGSAAYPIVEHADGEDSVEIAPNTFHVFGETTNLTILLGAEVSGVANEYLFQFTTGDTAPTFAINADVKWANDETPTFAANKIYQISILKGLATVLEFENLSPTIEFSISYDENLFQADRGSTWDSWIDSDYNTMGAQRYDNYVLEPESGRLIGIGASPVLLSDPIIEGTTYELVS